MFCLFTVLVSANLNFGSGYSTIQEHPKPDISAVEISYIILEKEQLQINSEILVCKYCLFKYCQTNFRDGGAISTQIQSSLANCYFQLLRSMSWRRNFFFLRIRINTDYFFCLPS